MALTLTQVTSLGFKPSKRSSLYGKKYDTLIYTINATDFLYVGYNEYSKNINNKIIWKSFKDFNTGERITYPVINIGSTSLGELKQFLDRTKVVQNYLNDQDESNVVKDNTESITGSLEGATLIPTIEEVDGESN